MTTPDPMTQAIMAMCSHPEFAVGCEPCLVRQEASIAWLVRLADLAAGSTE